MGNESSSALDPADDAFGARPPASRAEDAAAAFSRPRPRPSPHDGIDRAIEAFSRRAALSRREQMVLRYLARGYRYRDIGEQLRISARTVKMHAASVRRKVGVRSRYELLMRVYGDRS